MVTGDSKILSGVLEADTTISSRAVPSTRVILITWLLVFTVTRWDSKPTLLNSKTNGGACATTISNFPSKSVTVPCDDPITRTLVPRRGMLLLSTTVPVTVVWDKAGNETKIKNKKIKARIYVNVVN